MTATPAMMTAARRAARSPAAAMAWRGGVEACDDGNGDDLDGCRNDCTVAVCGDGVRRQDVAEGQAGYEACDDGNRADGRLPQQLHARALW